MQVRGLTFRRLEPTQKLGDHGALAITPEASGRWRQNAIATLAVTAPQMRRQI